MKRPARDYQVLGCLIILGALVFGGVGTHLAIMKVVAPAFREEERGPKNVEAIEWLTHNRNRNALSPRRFDSSAEALKFVRQLYAAGADSVVFPDTCRHFDDEGGSPPIWPYADCMVVKFPEEKEKWEPLVKLCIRDYLPESKAPEVLERMKNRRLVLRWK